MRADARRNRAGVLAAAREAMATNGPAVGMDEIARRAGVAVGTLYGHFPSKEALVVAVVDEALRELDALLEDALTSVTRGADAGEAFHTCFRAAAARHRTDFAVKRAAAGLGVIVPDATSPLAAPAMNALEQLLAAAAAAGAVSEDVCAADVAVLLEAVPTTGAAQAERYVDIVLRGLRPPAQADRAG